MGGKAKQPKPKIKIKTEWEKKEVKIKFPNCAGTYPDCPQREELSKYIKSKEIEDLPAVCRACPIFFKKVHY